MPPKYEPPKALYATEIENRRPKFKVHKNIGHARNALSYRNRIGFPEGIIYKLSPSNEWEVFEENIFDRSCHICGKLVNTTTWTDMVVEYGKKGKDRRVSHRNCKAEEEGRQWWVFNPSIHTVYGPFKDATDVNIYLRGKPVHWMAMPHAALKNYNGLKKVAP